MKLNEVKNELREMEKKRGPTQLSPEPVDINQSGDEEQSAKERGKDPTGGEPGRFSRTRPAHRPRIFCSPITFFVGSLDQCK